MKNELLNLIKKAMLSKNQTELRVLRLIKAKFMEYETAKGAKPLTDETEIEVLRKMLKERKDSIEKYTSADRPDLAKQEQDEIDIISKFVPTPPTEDELTEFLIDLLSRVDFNKGLFIKVCKEKFPMADGSTIARIVDSIK